MKNNKLGRPKKEITKKSSALVHIAMSQMEKAIISAAAKKRKMSISAFLRENALEAAKGKGQLMQLALNAFDRENFVFSGIDDHGGAVLIVAHHESIPPVTVQEFFNDTGELIPGCVFILEVKK